MNKQTDTQTIKAVETLLNENDIQIFSQILKPKKQ